MTRVLLCELIQRLVDFKHIDPRGRERSIVVSQRFDSSSTVLPGHLARGRTDVASRRFARAAELPPPRIGKS